MTDTWTLQPRGQQHGACVHQVARKDHADRHRACFENSINMMSSSFAASFLGMP